MITVTDSGEEIRIEHCPFCEKETVNPETDTKGDFPEVEVGWRCKWCGVLVTLEDEEAEPTMDEQLEAI